MFKLNLPRTSTYLFLKAALIFFLNFIFLAMVTISVAKRGGREGNWHRTDGPRPINFPAVR
jgi:hypothetical protein